MLLIVQWLGYLWALSLMASSYAYAKLDFALPGIAEVAVCAFTIAIIALLVPLRAELPSHFTIWALASFVTIPSLALAVAGASYSWNMRVAGAVVTVTGLVALCLLQPRRPLRQLRRVDATTPRSFAQLLMILVVAGLVLAVAGYGFSGLHLSLDDIYVRRLEFREVADPLPGAGYLLSWMSTPLIPILVAASIRWRRPTLAVLAVVVTLVLFSQAGAKSVLFSALFTVVTYWAVSRANSGSAWPVWSLFLTAAITIPSIVQVVTGNAYLNVLVTQRLGLVPARLTVEYLMFAERNGFTYFTQSVFKWFTVGEPPAIPRLVGDQINPGGATNANANVWADGHVSMGLAGVVIVTIALAAALRLADRLTLSRDRYVAGTTFAVSFFQLTNGSIFTALVGSGIGFAFILIWLAPTGPLGLRAQIASSQPSLRAATPVALPTSSNVRRLRAMGSRRLTKAQREFGDEI